MKIAKEKWLIWFQFASLFIFLVCEVNSKLLCGRLMKQKPKLPVNTRLASKQRKTDQVTLACDKGYYFSKGKKTKDVSCTSFKNSAVDQLPKCKGCGKPPSIMNGTIKLSQDEKVGSVASYSCDVGFTLLGSRKQRKCRSNLRWSGGKSRITCQKNKCPDPGKITALNANMTYSDRKFEEFSTISFQCHNGYEMFYGEDDVVCAGGKWSSKPLAICRKKRCRKPDPPENGRIWGNSYYIGDSVEFYCNSGFTLYGSRKRTCQDDKTWNGTVTTCDSGQSHCRDPGTPIGSQQTGRKYNEGDVVSYDCLDGLKLLHGSLRRICLKNGSWSGTPPRCVDEYYKEFKPINETANLLKESFVDSLLQTTCSGTNVTCPVPDARARALNLRYKDGLDLIFVLDTSSSIKKENFEIAREFVKTIVEIFGVDERADGDGTHIACVTYGTRAQTEFTFNDASVQTLKRALKRVDQIQYTRGATATRLALDLVRKVVLPSSKRPKSTKALFLVTDGESNVGGSPRKAANYLKNKKDVEIYVIGIGKKVKDDSLRELATNNENVFAIKNYKELKKVKKLIVTLPMKDYSECGVSPFKPHDARARIVGGEKTDERNWPWAVKIFVNDKQACGGTLINLEYVLTAAHCFHQTRDVTRPENVKVLFQDKKRTVFTSRQLLIHPDYDNEIFKNDIALIKIPKLKRFTRNQQAICLPRKVNSTRIIKHGHNMYAVGWGRTIPLKPKHHSKDEDISKDLKQVKLPFKANSFCASNVKNKTAQGLDNWYFNSTTQFCAGDVTGKNDTCHGDSGGPAMVLLEHPVSGKWRWSQIGIVSWGHGCAQKGEVGYYTKVSAFTQNWIDGIIQT